jgi:ABC-type branched-subunit amino acid transport system ATPase component
MSAVRDTHKALLSVDGIGITFGGLKAVDNVSVLQ